MIRKHIIYFLALGFLLGGCSKSEKITLKEWLYNEKLFQDFIHLNNPDCNYIKKVYEQLTIEEFQSKMYTQLLRCYSNDNHQIAKYMQESVRGGLYPKRIDTVKYNDVYDEIKGELHKLHKEYWKDRDTTHFAEIEKRVMEDQKYRTTTSLPSEKNLQKIKEIEKQNEKYLLKLCEQNGFPVSVYPNKFKSYRIIDPTIMAMHASDTAKLELLKCAVKSAKTGDISWTIPINISISLFSSEKSHKDVYPLWQLFYDNDENLNIDKSYLQLFSIKKLFDKDNSRKIKIQPSKYYKADKELVRCQLIEIKKALIQEFSFSKENLVISDVGDSHELNYMKLKPYKFTLSILD